MPRSPYRALEEEPQARANEKAEYTAWSSRGGAGATIVSVPKKREKQPLAAGRKPRPLGSRATLNSGYHSGPVKKNNNASSMAHQGVKDERKGS